MGNNLLRNVNKKEKTHKVGNQRYKVSKVHQIRVVETHKVGNNHILHNANKIHLLRLVTYCRKYKSEILKEENNLPRNASNKEETHKLGNQLHKVSKV